MYPRLQFAHLLSRPRTKARRAKQPAPLDPARPTVLQLPESVLEHIFSFLSNDYLDVVASLGSSLYRVARSVQHRELEIDLEGDDNHALDRLHLLVRLDQLSAVRTLRVRAHKYRPGQNQADAILARLADAVPGMTGLKDLHWHVDSIKLSDREHQMTAVIPAPILASLPAEARLHTSVFCNEVEESHVHARAFLHALVDNTNLHALSVRVAYIEEQMCVDTMGPLKRVLLSCPKLTRIPHMDIGYLQLGCVSYGPSAQGAPYCGLGFIDGERPQPFEELGLRRYPWGSEGMLHSLGYDGGGYSREWDYWAYVFDWSHLARINGDISTLLTTLAPRLTGLKELVLKDLYWFEDKFIDDITAPLELISITNCGCFDKPELIARFGPTLRELRIHRPGHWSHRLATIPSLEHLSKNLPHLEHLSVDLDPQQGAQHQWNHEALNAIAAFPSLRSVELWSPPGISPPSQGPAPILTADAARHLFYYLRGRNDRIQRAIFHSGERHMEKSALGHQPIAVWGRVANDDEPQWNQLNAVTFECTVVYPVGEQGSRVHITCPYMSLGMNLQLLRMDQQTERRLEDLKKLDPEELRLRAALVGALSQDDWRVWKTHYERRLKRQNTIIGKFVPDPFRRTLEW